MPVAISARQRRLVRRYVRDDGALPEHAAEMAGVDVDQVHAALATDPAPAREPYRPVDRARRSDAHRCARPR